MVGLDVFIHVLLLPTTALTYLRNWWEIWHFFKRQLLWEARHIFIFIFLSLVIYVTIYHFHLNKILLMHILKTIHEDDDWFVHIFQKYFEHTQRLVQSLGKCLQCSRWWKYFTVLCGYAYIRKSSTSSMLDCIVNTPVIPLPVMPLKNAFN